MTKQAKKQQQRITDLGSTLTIGLDIGYGVVKAVTDQTAITFPSVMGHAHEIKFQQETLQQKYPGDHITDEDGQWFVGDLALAQVPAGELLRLRGRTANEKTMGNAFRLRLAKVAIGKLLPGVWGRDVAHLRLAVGLPVDHMRDAAQLKETLYGQHLIQTDACEVIANVTEGKGVEPLLEHLARHLAPSDGLELEVVGSLEMEPACARRCVALR